MIVALEIADVGRRHERSGGISAGRSDPATLLEVGAMDSAMPGAEYWTARPPDCIAILAKRIQ